MEDWIFELNELAKKLLANASDLDDELDKFANGSPSTEFVGEVKDKLGSMCNALTEVGEILSQQDGPLGRLIQKLDGAKVCADAAGNLKRFLDSHEKMLRNIGVPKEMIDELLGQLAKQLKGGYPNIEEPQTITNKDGNDFKKQLDELRKLICEIHKNAELFNDVWNPEILRVCVKGVMGACLIVVDITGALAAPDFTGFVLVKAVKSTWSGYRMVTNAVEKIRGLWDGLKGGVRVKVRQENLKKHKPPKTVLKRGDKEP